jgi:hypothetical protein
MKRRMTRTQLRIRLKSFEVWLKRRENLVELMESGGKTDMKLTFEDAAVGRDSGNDVTAIVIIAACRCDNIPRIARTNKKSWMGRSIERKNQHFMGESLPCLPRFYQR